MTLLLFAFYIVLIIGCLVTYLLNRQYFPSFFIYFVYLFATIIVFELAGMVLANFGMNHYVPDHIYQPVEVTLLSIIYFHVVPYTGFKNFVRSMVPVFWVFSIVSSCFVEGMYHPNTISFVGGSILIIVYSLVYLYQLYALPPSSESLFYHPFFWINTGHLFFYFGTFFQMGMDSYIRRIDVELADRLVVINYALNFALYLLYMTGFLCRKALK